MTDATPNPLPPRHIHTDRLCLSAPTPADERAVAEIQGDPATNAFNPNGPTGPREAAAMLVGWIADWDRDGVGYWVVRESGGCAGEVVGVAGVRRTGGLEADRAVYNLYYRFRPSAWGSGYAREAAAAAVRAAAEREEPALVLAVIREQNVPSARVAAAVGLSPDGTTTHHGSESLRFALRV
ncbi:GNAT family N-acetyltransferase [Actinospica robiniae]|uniref:GNAT family N-acetyltransferase n=1 Tax=Actinospica robiniae TaxID=304901 RepID=UPI00040A3904|nr:GNAT family N-acetyltransferase [Actinospica robiniae]